MIATKNAGTAITGTGTNEMTPRNMIGHVFTGETKAKLRVGREDFLLPEEERMFRGMLERHGKAFAFFPQEIGCANPRTVELMVIFTVPHVPWNLNTI